jgi:hypothetical protein
MDVAFDSLHEDVRQLSFRLSSMGLDTFSVGPLECRLIHFICQQCEASLQFLLFLSQQKLFRDRILKNKVCLSELCFCYAIEKTRIMISVLLCLPFYFMHCDSAANSSCHQFRDRNVCTLFHADYDFLLYIGVVVVYMALYC